MHIHIIAAALPPQLDGIGDYTAYLSSELAKSEAVTVFTNTDTPHNTIEGVTIVPAFSVGDPRSVWNMLDQVRHEAPDWVLLQYQPFSYGRWGLNLHLPLVMRQIKRCCPGTNFALMMHEPFVPIINLKFAVMTTWQRWQLWQLGRAADLMFCSIEPWAQRFGRWFPKTPVRHLPVGSNIPRVAISRTEARLRLGIADETLVLGLFGTAHISRMLGWVRGAAEAVQNGGHKILVLYMGPDGVTVCRVLDGLMTMAEGPLASEEISRRFAALDIVLAPFIDGVSTRRTSLMTGLQHGIATVGTEGVLTDAMLSRENGQAFLLADARTPLDFNTHVLSLADDTLLRERIAHAGQRLYSSEFTWSRIADQLLMDFQGV